MPHATAPKSAALHGAEWRPDEGTLFRLWAPQHDAIDLVIEGESVPRRMQAQDEGWKQLLVPEAKPGARYRFRMPDGLMVPDPASRYQPDDVHGPSEVIDPDAFAWTDDGWAGRAWNEVVLYELHLGTFTPAGTFQAAIDKLDHLVGLGVTAVEIMPVADFPGQRNWGYDGVLPYAPDATYGRPEDFKAFVAAAHRRGIAVVLDVVYNHFGPDGNYLGAYAPGFFTERHHTPWGAAVNVDGEHSRPVRDYFIGNALYWLTEFHLDGLRFDAVHAILDDSDLHLLRELVETARRTVTDRPIHLILENEDNVASRLTRHQDGSLGRYTAQWNDDVHHVLHVAATGEDRGYYEAYAGKTDLLGRALAEGFAYQGEYMPYRDGTRGEPSGELPPGAFVAFLQNHDQIGNRAFGERIGTLAKQEAVRAASAVYLLAPQTPMLFMGEEWGATAPFLFFCDFSGELAELVRKGRREEFSRFPEFQDPEMRQRIPDPEAPDTFAASKLDWAEIGTEPHRDQLAWMTRILAVRRDAIAPLIPAIGANAGSFRTIGDSAVVVTWTTLAGARLRLDANLKDAAQDGFEQPAGRTLWVEGRAEAERLGSWSVRWTLDETA